MYTMGCCAYGLAQGLRTGIMGVHENGWQDRPQTFSARVPLAQPRGMADSLRDTSFCPFILKRAV